MMNLNFLDQKIAIILPKNDYKIRLYDDIITTDDEYDATIIRHLTDSLDFNIQLEGSPRGVVEVDKFILLHYKHAKNA